MLGKSRLRRNGLKHNTVTKPVIIVLGILTYTLAINNTFLSLIGLEAIKKTTSDIIKESCDPESSEIWPVFLKNVRPTVFGS